MSDLIHCITNPISMMMCANAILSLGARPIMAEHPLEVMEITETAGALLINLGNISDTRMEAMKISFSKALEKEIPVVIDAVGVACSELRRSFILSLISSTPRSDQQILLIKGNYSEIIALLNPDYKGNGVDAGADVTKDMAAEHAIMLSRKLDAIVLASGATDIITDGEKTYLVNNGNPQLGKITGTGCMLGAICATFFAGVKDRGGALFAAVRACEHMGIAGELAYEAVSSINAGKVGSGSFYTALFDEISLLDDKTISERRKVEKL